MTSKAAADALKLMGVLEQEVHNANRPTSKSKMSAGGEDMFMTSLNNTRVNDDLKSESGIGVKSGSQLRLMVPTAENSVKSESIVQNQPGEPQEFSIMNANQLIAKHYPTFQRLKRE